MTRRIANPPTESDTMDPREPYRDHIELKTILAIAAEPAHPKFPERASFWHIDFYVESYCLALTTNADTDEIIVTVEPASLVPPTDPPLLADLRGLIGRRFGWSWHAVNSQGYSDMLILAFDGIAPQLAFLVEASTIKVRRIASLEARSA